MSDDVLLHGLAQRVREHERELERLERLISDPRAARTEIELEALRPLDPAFRKATVEKLSGESSGFATLTGDRTAQRSAPGVIDGLRRALEQLVAPLRASSWPILGLGAVAAAAVVAALTLGVYREGLESSGAFAPYGLTLQGKAFLRGEQSTSSGPVVLGTGDEFKLLLRPESAVQGPLAVRAYVLKGETQQPLQAPSAQVLDNGIALIAGRIGADVLFPEGDAKLLVVIGRPDALPDGAELARRLRGIDSVRTDEWLAWSVEIRRSP
jgi:hypothetical protein